MSEGTRPAAAPRGGSQTLEISLLGTAAFLLRHRVLLLALPALCTVLFLALSVLFRGNSYVARSTFLPQVAQSNQVRLANLASQLGIRSPEPSGASPEFYAELLKSRRVLREAAASTYFVTDADGDSVAVRLPEVFEVEAEGDAARLRAAVGILSQSVEVGTSQSGIMSLRTEAPTPEIAVQLNRRLLALVDEFNRDRRLTAAKAERSFVEARYGEAQKELAAAEADLERFLASNRYYQGSPQLMLEANRLTRRVDLRQEVAGSLAQAYEQARIEEVRYTPVITLLDDPADSVSGAGGASLSLILLSGIVLGGLLALGIAATKEYLRWQAEVNPSEFGELREAAKGVRLRRFWRRTKSAGPAAAARHGHDAGSAD